MFSGYGIRTLSIDQRRLLAPALPRRVGVVPRHRDRHRRACSATASPTRRPAWRRGCSTAAEGFDYRLPELFGGHPADEVWPPVPYPASCRPQAWAAASVVPIARALGALEVLG